jgi:hypothetical protein
MHPPQKLECPPFWNGSSYRIKKYSTEVLFRGMASLSKLIKTIKIEITITH